MRTTRLQTALSVATTERIMGTLMIWLNRSDVGAAEIRRLCRIELEKREI